MAIKIVKNMINAYELKKYYPETFFRTACIWRLFCKYRDKTFFGITLIIPNSG